jgi:hypothetical protein
LRLIGNLRQECLDYFLKNGVPSYIRSLYDKCGVQNGVEAVSLAWTLGLLDQRP